MVAPDYEPASCLADFCNIMTVCAKLMVLAKVWVKNRVRVRGLILGHVALGAQQPILIKLSRGRSVGLYVLRSVQCSMEKRRIGSGCRLAS